jgi:hypothetical protein
MITKRTADAIITSSTDQQCVDLLDCSLGAAETELQCPLHLWWKLLLELARDRTLIELAQCAALPLQPCEQSGDLADPGDGAAGDLGELLIDLRRSSLCNLAGGFSEAAVNTETACVDLIA